MTRKVFTYKASELPEVKLGKSWPIGDEGEIVTYHQVGLWSFSDLAEEDGDIESVREAILAWTAWYEFLINGGLDNE